MTYNAQFAAFLLVGAGLCWALLRVHVAIAEYAQRRGRGYREDGGSDATDVHAGDSAHGGLLRHRLPR